MKKLVIFVLLTLICFNFSCEKDNKYLAFDPFIVSLVSFIEDLDNYPIESISSEEYFNYANPLENLMMVYDHKLIKSIRSNEIQKGTDIQNIFSEEFLSSFPSIEPESINSETSIIIKKINKVLISNDSKDCIPRLKKIENFIVRNKKLNGDYSDLLLGYSTFLRHAVIIHEEFDVSKDDEDITWEECMTEKANQLADCKNCYVEKAYFALSWPLSLSIWAIDCGIASLID